MTTKKTKRTAAKRATKKAPKRSAKKNPSLPPLNRWVRGMVRIVKRGGRRLVEFKTA
jgi:hypothetical protein